jgi:PAS domain S-box-containing protein
VIIKLSSEWKIVEFNPEAEKFFGVKRENAINQDFFQMFVPEPMHKVRPKQVTGKDFKQFAGWQVKNRRYCSKGNMLKCFFSQRYCLTARIWPPE